MTFWILVSSELLPSSDQAGSVALLIPLLMQAEVVGDAIGKGIVELITQIAIVVGLIGGFVLFLWLVRRVDKRINK